MKTLSFTLIATLLLAPLTAIHAADAPTAKPNVILILADDLGYEYTGENGATSYQTPHLDRMALQQVLDSMHMKPDFYMQGGVTRENNLVIPLA